MIGMQEEPRNRADSVKSFSNMCRQEFAPKLSSLMCCSYRHCTIEALRTRLTSLPGLQIVCMI